MADLAFGAVHSLLGLLHDEAQALVRLGDDVQFIREEMESMNSFLLYLVQTAPPSGEHEGPVRAWMKQVRDLASDCSNCVDLYVLRGRGSPARDNAASRGFLGCLLWMPCSVPALCAQREAAAQIRELKARARDVGERRQRYGVELPKITADDSHEDALGVVSDDFIRRVVLGFPEELNILEEHAHELIRSLTADAKGRVPGHDDGHEEAAQAAAEAAQAAAAAPPPPHAIKKVIGIVAPDKDQDGGDVARKALDDPSVKKLFRNKLWLTVDYMFLRAQELVRWLTADAKGRVRGHDDGHEEAAQAAAAAEAAQAAAAAAPPHPHAIKKVIVIVAPDKDQDGGDVARKALEDPSVKKLFRNKHWLTVDYMFGMVNIRPEEGAWYVHRAILDNLLPAEDAEMLARDQWDEARMVKEIKERLGMEGTKSLFVIEGFHDVKDRREWKLMEDALSKFGCAAGSAVIVIAKGIHDAYQLIGSQSQRIIYYSLVDFFYIKAMAVVDRGYKRNYLTDNLRDVLRLIHDRCERQAFCMKMFVHYLYAKPNRTKEELDKLLRALVSPESSLDGTDAAKLREDNGKKLLNFCYEDLPRTYKACMLYLAIFPPDVKISRSRLVGRWIVEGLIIGRDMPHAVREAERCFDALLKRWLVIPCDIGATGKVKSCMVKNDLVKELIAEKAREEQFLDPRLSRHLAQHFSVHSDLRLRRSDNITNFVGSLRKNSRGNAHTSSQLMLLNVLDLEGCPELRDPLNENQGKEHFINNQRQYLENIFSKIHLLKYLSLRNTYVSELPKEINNLMRLEILDIRQTRVPSSATKYILLPRLKCLLAGRTEISISDNTGADETFSAVQIPRHIGKMVNLEVLSHVEASKDADKFIHIGKQLWQLRKLGVVIDGNEDCLKNLLQAISDLNECLRSLSIRIVEPRS